jgi:hypothetical protein
MKQSLNIATGFGLDGWALIPDREGNFSPLHSIQSASGVHLTPYEVCAGAEH